VPKLPDEQDPVDWLLFDLKQGFCNYFATAEVVLLRAVGIPARWAVGYSQGKPTSNGDTNIYEIRYENAHSWPEVYFPEYGWIEFEPTTNQDPLIRPVGGDPTSSAGTLPLNSNGINTGRDEIREQEELLEAQADRLRDDTRDSTTEIERNPIPWGFLLTFGGIALLIWGWRALRDRGLPPVPVLIESGMDRYQIVSPNILRTWAQWASLSPLERAYQEVNWILSGLDVQPNLMDTPKERMSTLIQLVPEVSVPAQILLEKYQDSRFGSLPRDNRAMPPALWSIRRHAYKAVANHIFEKIKQKFAVGRLENRN
jgi:hypothetical protein